MTAPSEKLAQSLEKLKELQNNNGIAVVRTEDLSRTHLDRLVSQGFLKRVIKGWYLSCKPEEKDGDSTSWYTSFWNFSLVYFNSRFKDKWCLSPEQSMKLQSGNTVVPKQLLVRSPKANNNITKLLFDTSFLEIELKLPSENEIDIINGLRVYSIPAGLISCSPDFFANNQTEAITCLASLKDTSEILRLLLDGNNTVKAGRIAGALRAIGKDLLADEILETMKAAGFESRESNPFNSDLSIELPENTKSPLAIRIKLLWDQMRPIVMKEFQDEGRRWDSIQEYLKKVDEIYVADAYNSLSIEGYIVNEELIKKIRSGKWEPLNNEGDRKQKDALAARGYWQCFQKVKTSIKKIYDGSNPGEVFSADLNDWYRELFAPCVDAGILKPSDLAGYRNTQVYIAGSKHTPPGKENVRETMPVLFELLSSEENVFVKSVLGHFFFVYIHPYVDGNGRIARFLMNLMLASGGYPWIIIKVNDRKTYMEALEQASVNSDISMFAKYIAELLSKNDD